MIDYNEVVRLKKLKQRAKDDKLIAFTSAPEAELLDRLLERNLEMLFNEARKFGIRYIYVGRGEISGCEGMTDKASHRPAIWDVAMNVGFPGSCGNMDQYQCTWSEEVFPEDAYGAWDLNKNLKLENFLINIMNFNLVVTEHPNL